MESQGQPADLEHILQILRRALYRDPDAPPAPGEPEERVFVRGQDESGLLLVAVQSGDIVYQLKVPDVQTLVSLVGPPLKPYRPDDALLLPFTPKTSTALPVDEQRPDIGQSHAMRLGGELAQQVVNIAAARGEASCVAVYTCRGPTLQAQKIEYKPFNEDAVALRLLRGDRATGRQEICAAGAFDMAGGEGSVEGRAGAASDVASRCFDEAIRAIETGKPPEEALREGVIRASEAVRALGVGAVSTFTAAVIITEFKDQEVVTRRAHIASVGDSRALLVDKTGKLKEKSRLHNLGASIAAGEVADAPPSVAHQFASALSRGLGTENDLPDFYTWELAPGDRIVVETDGVGDAREFEQMPQGVWHADRCAEDQARILGHVRGAPETAATLVAYALDQMAERYGKPDNIGLAVLEALE